MDLATYPLSSAEVKESVELQIYFTLLPLCLLMADYRVNLTFLFVEVKIQSKFVFQLSPHYDKTVRNGSIRLKTGVNNRLL